MLGILIGILSLISVAAFIWFVVLAFSKSKGWGFAVMFIPLVKYYFAAKNWAQVKKPFLLYILSSGLAVVLLVVSVFMSPGDGSSVVVTRNLSRTLDQTGTQRTLTEAEKMTVSLLEMRLSVIEKLPETQQQQVISGILQRYIQFKKTILTDKQLSQFKQETEALLLRTDLNDNQRQEFNAILEEIELKVGAPFAQHTVIPQKTNTSASGPEQAVPAVSTDEGSKRHSPQIKVTPEQKKGPLPQQTEIGKIVSKANDPESGEGETSSPYKRISFRQAKNHIGSQLFFIGPRGNERECILVGASESSIQCRKQSSSGTFSFSYKNSEIKRLKVPRP